jgi:hypothetical protein
MNEKPQPNTAEIKRFSSKILALQGQAPREHWLYNAQKSLQISENPTKIESEIVLPSYIGRFMAGLLETGGHMGLHVSNEHGPVRSDGSRKSITRVRPIISYFDTRPEKMKILQEFFGGSINTEKRVQRSLNWQVRDSAAYDLANLIEPWVVSKRDIVSSFRNCENSYSNEERIDIARVSKTLERYSASAADYLVALEDPAFLAGVFESKGAFMYSPSGGEQIRLTSSNKPLLEAVKVNNGGGNVLDIKVDDYQYYWLDLAVQDASRFVGKIEPYMITPIAAYRSQAA